MKVVIKPIEDQVVIEPIVREKMKIGEIIIPKMESNVLGTVFACGPGKETYTDGRLITMEVKKGDTVIYGRGVGAPIVLGEQKLVMMRQSDIIAILEEIPDLVDTKVGK